MQPSGIGGAAETTACIHSVACGCRALTGAQGLQIPLLWGLCLCINWDNCTSQQRLCSGSGMTRANLVAPLLVVSSTVKQDTQHCLSY